jgi:co-chaperonin GroES (HSP10)
MLVTPIEDNYIVRVVSQDDVSEDRMIATVVAVPTVDEDEDWKNQKINIGDKVIVSFKPDWKLIIPLYPDENNCLFIVDYGSIVGIYDKKTPPKEDSSNERVKVS